MKVRYVHSAWRHGITEEEIHAVLTYPLLRYRIEAGVFPDADSYMFVGRIEHEPWLCVGAEDMEDHWVVFHASLITRRVANEAYWATGETVDLRQQVIRQRPGTQEGESQ